MSIRNVTVTGGAGFIGSHMVDTLLDAGCRVTIVDNFRTGLVDFLPEHGEWDLVRCDITRDYDQLMMAIDGADWVVHLAANPDARGERRGVGFNLDQNLTGTLNVLEAMKHVGADRILYASSASIYGDTLETPVPEDFRMVPQVSFYGASKLAAEGLIGSYCAMYGFTGINARWVHILGERYLHGHIIDFLRKLRRDPTRLHILGDGTQAKSGLHARNLCEGLWAAMQHHDNDPGACEAYNFGGDTLLTVRESAELICAVLKNQGFFGDDGYAKFTYSGRPNGGWVGDNPHLVLDSTKARTTLGWEPTMSVPDAIRLTAEWLTSPECRYL
jgi:UDP-glucose 4-epimerase